MNTSSWIKIAGEPDSQLAALLQSRVEQHIAAGEYSWDNQKYIEKVHFFPIPDGISIAPERLERLRLLCQLWDVKLRPREITSHRKFIGPVIVAVKKLIFPIIQALFKDAMHQQRSFNAASIALLAELSEEIERLRVSPHEQ